MLDDAELIEQARTDLRVIYEERGCDPRLLAEARLTVGLTDLHPEIAQELLNRPLPFVVSAPDGALSVVFQPSEMAVKLAALRARVERYEAEARDARPILVARDAEARDADAVRFLANLNTIDPAKLDELLRGLKGSETP